MAEAAGSPVSAAAATRAGRRQSLADAWAMMPVSGRIGLAVLLAYAAVAVTGPLWAPYAPGQIAAGPPLSSPTLAHPMGTDSLGRDLFSRVVYGTAAVMVMALSSTGIAVILGAIVGLVSGYMRGWVDEIIMRIADILISMPPLIIAILVISAFGNHQLVIILIVALLFAPRVARVVRAATLGIVTEDYVTAAVCRGESALGIAVRELLPNVTGTVFVEFAIRSGFAIMFIGALGFLGFGAPPPTPEWGVMINEGRRTISASLWPVLSPALAMAGLVLAINLFTEGVARVIGRSPGSAGR